MRTHALGFVCALLLSSAPALAQTGADAPVTTGGPAVLSLGAPPQDFFVRHDKCIAKAEAAPDEAYEDGLVWRLEGGGALALHCVARAQLALGQYDAAGERLELVAGMREIGDDKTRAMFLTEAGHAFLLAHRAADAKRNFDSAVALTPNDLELRIDRAEAALIAEDWKGAVADLDFVLKSRPADVTALRMRGEAKLSLQDLDGAAADADAALKADPKDVSALLLRGRVREAKAGRPS